MCVTPSGLGPFFFFFKRAGGREGVPKVSRGWIALEFRVVA